MPRFSVNQVTTKRWSLEEDAFHYSGLGTQGIGLWRDKVSDFGDEKTRDLLNDFSLQPSSFSYVGGFTGCQGRWRDCVKDAIQTLISARAVGARNVLLFTGSLNGHIRPQAMRCLLDAMEHLMPFAEELGVRLLLQPMMENLSRKWNFLYDWESVFGVIDRFPSQMVGFVLHTYHATFLSEIWSQLPSRIEQLGLVQISDAPHFPRQGRSRNDCILGEGLMMPDVRLGQVIESGYEGWIEVESAGPAIYEAGYLNVLKANRHFLSSFQSANRSSLPSKTA